VVYFEVNETCCIEARRYHEKLREDELRSWRSRQQERYELFQHALKRLSSKWQPKEKTKQRFRVSSIFNSTMRTSILTTMTGVPLYGRYVGLVGGATWPKVGSGQTAKSGRHFFTENIPSNLVRPRPTVRVTHVCPYGRSTGRRHPSPPLKKQTIYLQSTNLPSSIYKGTVPSFHVQKSIVWLTFFPQFKVRR
jgi:hypothetical protein